MEITFMPTMLATTFYLTSIFSGASTSADTAVSMHKVLPARAENVTPAVTPKPAISGKVGTTVATSAVTVTPAPTAIPITAVPTTTAPVNTPASGFDDVYKAAGAKYGIPWEILYGLHITETGGRDGMIMNGSGSGARGPMQFMPGTWAAYGVDGDGDGVANIDSAVDAIHGAANYLAKHGSLDNGLTTYGGAKARTLQLARERGYSQ